MNNISVYISSEQEKRFINQAMLAHPEPVDSKSFESQRPFHCYVAAFPQNSDINLLATTMDFFQSLEV
jgi:hypothetical protein